MCQYNNTMKNIEIYVRSIALSTFKKNIVAYDFRLKAHCNMSSCSAEFLKHWSIDSGSCSEGTFILYSSLRTTNTIWQPECVFLIIASQRRALIVSLLSRTANVRNSFFFPWMKKRVPEMMDCQITLHKSQNFRVSFHTRGIKPKNAIRIPCC